MYRYRTVPSVSNKQKNLPIKKPTILIFCLFLESTLENTRIRIQIQTRVCNPLFGSKDPDPAQNVTDPDPDPGL
jgi:hypothetical protein